MPDQDEQRRPMPTQWFERAEKGARQLVARLERVARRRTPGPGCPPGSTPGDADFPPLEDAPGSYVKEKAARAGA